MLFTDIEGSTALATRLGPDWPRVLGEHHRILQEAIASAGGYVDHTEGDAFFATFSDPGAAARAAVTAQRGLRAHPWPEPVLVRMGLHVGFVQRGAVGYLGLEVHRAARVGAAAHGGQLILTGVARETLGDRLAVDYLGAFRLKDFPAPVQLYSAVIDGRGAASFPPPRTLDARPTNLPAGLPSLVGRDPQLQEISQALTQGRDRLVTLTGPGGAGKTSLALVAAAGLLDDYPGGVWWVDLSQLLPTDRILDAVVSAIGADREVRGSALEAITGRLAASGKVLMVLDNLEHLAGAWNEVGDLLNSLPDLRALCTSRMSLRLPRERVMIVDALDGEAALELVGQTITRRGHSWSPQPADQEALLDVAELLDGLPLALELAAARLELLSPVQLRDRLRSSSDLLRDPSRPERQRSLNATVDWTLKLLDQAPRMLFTRLGVFAGPALLDEVELVTGGDGLDVLEALSILLDVALVRRVEHGDGRIRFGLPEALRQIAARQLDVAPDARRWRLAHAERQLDLLRVGVATTDAEEVAAKAALPEATAGLRWAQRNREGVAEELAARVCMWTVVAGRLREGTEMLAPLIETPPEKASLRSLVYGAQGIVMSLTGQPDESLRFVDLALANADSEVEIMGSIQLRGLVKLFAGSLQDALDDHHEASRMARRMGPLQLATMLVMEAQALTVAGDVATATRLLSEARRVGEPVGAAALRATDSMAGDLAMAAGRPGEAIEPYARSLEDAQRRGDQLQVLFDLRGMANALGALGRDEDAAEVLGLADVQAEEVGGSQNAAKHLQADRLRAALDRLSPETAEAARARGHAVGPGRRVARACELGRAVVSA